MVAGLEDDEDELLEDRAAAKRQREFDCPHCNANNPLEEPLQEGVELLCHYCGADFRVHVSGQGRMKLKEL